VWADPAACYSGAGCRWPSALRCLAMPCPGSTSRSISCTYVNSCTHCHSSMPRRSASQVVIKLPGGGKCHPGPADMVRLEQGGNRVISAGAGGWLRIWDTSSLTDTEPAEGGLTAEVEPLAQVRTCRPGLQYPSTITKRKGDCTGPVSLLQGNQVARKLHVGAEQPARPT
jgi:hypothetical protein